jgi:hypothetical protein
MLARIPGRFGRIPLELHMPSLAGKKLV